MPLAFLPLCSAILDFSLRRHDSRDHSRALDNEEAEQCARRISLSLSLAAAAVVERESDAANFGVLHFALCLPLSVACSFSNLRVRILSDISTHYVLAIRPEKHEGGRERGTSWHQLREEEEKKKETSRRCSTAKTSHLPLSRLSPPPPPPPHTHTRLALLPRTPLPTKPL